MPAGFIGIVASTRRPPSVSSPSLSNPTVNTTNYPDADSWTTGGVKRKVDWSITIDADTFVGSGATYKIDIKRTSTDATAYTTNNLSLTTAGTKTGTTTIVLDYNVNYYMVVTVTDIYGQVSTFYSDKSVNITTSNITYVNIAYNKGAALPDSNTNGSTYYYSAWKNPNTSTRTVKTSGTTSGGAANAFDGSSSTHWVVSNMNTGDYGACVGEMSYSEDTVASEAGRSIVSSTASAVGIVEDTVQWNVYGVQWRTQQRNDSYFFIRDDGPPVDDFITSTSLPSDGTMGNINLNDYDSQPYISFRNNDSTDIPNINGTSWNSIPFGTVVLRLTAWYYLGVARVVNVGLHILQTMTSSQTYVTDAQIRFLITYTVRKYL